MSASINTTVQDLKQDLERERKQAEEARREAATALGRIEALTEKAAETQAERDQLKADLARCQQKAQAQAVAVATAQAQAEAAREAKDTALAGLALERERLRALEEAITKEREAWTRERAGISPRQSSSDA